MPDLIDDVRQPPNGIIATGFKHFRRNLADALALVIFQQLHSLFYLIHGYWMFHPPRDAAALIVGDMAFPILY